MITSARLVDGDNEMVLLPNPDIDITALNLGFPAVRAVTESRTDDDGEDDTTELFGARAVSMNLTLYNTPAALVDQLRAFLSPRARPYLYLIDSEWSGERRWRLRVDQSADPITEGADDILREVQLQWSAPDGVWEATDLSTVNIAAESTTASGLGFPISYPIAWPSTAAAGVTQIDTASTIPLHWVARMYGPCDGPRLTNATTGQQLAFQAVAATTNGLSVAAGEYIEVDSRARSAYYLSDAGASRLSALDFANSDWWQLAAGINLVRFNPVLVLGPGCSAVIEYRPAGL